MQWILTGISIVLLFPATYSLFEDAKSTPAYLIPSAICIIFGITLKRFYPGVGNFRLREGFVFLVLSRFSELFSRISFVFKSFF